MDGMKVLIDIIREKEGNVCVCCCCENIHHNHLYTYSNNSSSLYAKANDLLGYYDSTNYEIYATDKYAK